MNRFLIAQESDHHGGNKVGLMNPNVVLERINDKKQTENYHPALLECQRELWELREENIRRLIELAGDDAIHYIGDGDLTQGNKHEADLVTTRMAEQVLIAAANMVPIFEIPNIKSFRFAAGTGAHNFGQASSDILVTSMLKAIYKKADIGLCYHGLIHYGDFTVDYAHHGPYTGSREWLKGNVARYYLQSLMFHSIKRGNKPPDLVIRGHYHVPVIETVRLNGFMSNIIVSPSMCMMDDYAHQAAKSPEDVTCGMLVYEVINGKLFDIHQFTKTYDTRTEYYIEP